MVSGLVSTPAPTAQDAAGLGRVDTLTHEVRAGVLTRHRARAPGREAAFFLPHLRPGMRLLDVGCGSGSITVDLGAVVAPAEAVGVDIAPAGLDRARALAAAGGVPGARFEVASAYALPFPDASFDAAFASAVLEHLADPLAALTEVRRVLAPGGVLGVRDPAYWGLIVPSGPEARRFVALVALHDRIQEHSGGHRAIGEQYRALLRAAGFVGVAASASCTWHGTQEATRRWGESDAGLLAGGDGTFVEWALDEGGADGAAPAGPVAAGSGSRGAPPDALPATLWSEAVGRNPSACPPADAAGQRERC